MASSSQRGLGAAAILATVLLTGAAGRAEIETIDIKGIFRCTAGDTAGTAACDRARDLVLFNCTVCHVFVRIVRKQADPAEWDGVLARHRVRVAQLSDDQFRAIRDYLVASFRPDLPPPDLPEPLATLY